jgi:glycogen operon protein
MLSHGDELARTQGGNNNAYCQDNELTWVDWDLTPERRELLEFTRRVLAIRRAHPALRRRTFLDGAPVGDCGVKDVTWLRADGREFANEDWHDPQTRALGMLLYGGATGEGDGHGRVTSGTAILVLLNGGGRSTRFRLPRLPGPGAWVQEVHTARPGARVVRGDAVPLVAHSLVLLRYGEPS